MIQKSHEIKRAFCPFQQGLRLGHDRFEQMSLYTLMILCKYFDQSYKHHYLRGGLSTYQFVSVSMIQTGFRFDAAKKLSLCETAII